MIVWPRSQEQMDLFHYYPDVPLPAAKTATALCRGVYRSDAFDGQDEFP
jgi:hypothetical protein